MLPPNRPLRKLGVLLRLPQPRKERKAREKKKVKREKKVQRREKRRPRKNKKKRSSL